MFLISLIFFIVSLKSKPSHLRADLRKSLKTINSEYESRIHFALRSPIRASVV